MRRFFVKEATEDSVEARLRGDELRHLKVLRLREGDEVLLFNGKGLELTGRIKSLGEVEALVDILSTALYRRESPLNTILLAGLPKADKPDFVVQKATELGVSSIIFYSAKRSVPEASGLKLEKKLLRWHRIALEACKQCGRTSLPLIAYQRRLTDALTSAVFAEVKLFFNEAGGRPIKEILEVYRGRQLPRSAVMLIGPEGGLTEAEGYEALQSGYIAATMGPRTLRTETAAITCVAIVQNLLGDF